MAVYFTHNQYLKTAEEDFEAAELLFGHKYYDQVVELCSIAMNKYLKSILEENDTVLGGFIEDEGSTAPTEAVADMMRKKQLLEVLETLTPREEKVLRLRYGLDDGRIRTLEEVGKIFNVTRERIRQIEAKALRKLKHPSRSKKLRDYLE